MSYSCTWTGIEYLCELGPARPGRHWALVTGCSPCSEGCEHCWAAAQARRWKRDFSFRYHPERLDAPGRIRKPSVIGVAFGGDLFHDGVPDEFILNALRVMIDESRHVFVLTTKRPARMAKVLMGWLAGERRAFRAGHIWLGVTVENQARADERLPHLERLAEAGWNTWVSAEPLLGRLSLPAWVGERSGVVAGCESRGPHLGRPADLDWIRDLRDACESRGAAFYLKQMEGQADDQPGGQTGTLVKRPSLDGVQHLEVPWGGGVRG